jgi:hypothetical protein
MLRQKRRRIKRGWDKYQSIVNCVRDCSCCERMYSCDCTEKVTIIALPNTSVDFLLKVSEDLLLEYNLNMFERWRLYPILVVDGFFFRDDGLYFDIGLASDSWFELHFGEDDDIFEYA